jgi:hypothetical protein
VVTLWWPQNGAQISGSGFTWRGTVDDPTVTLSAQITDTNGDVNVVGGVIERNGNFWVDNLPLAPGTNWLTLTAVDINNNTNTTNIYVVQSSVGLSITANDAITTQTAITVSGTIGTGGYLVWVNGVLANQSGGNWTAYNVPVNGDGVQVIQACAIPDTQTDNYGYGTGSGGGGTNSSLSNPGNPFARDAVCAEYNPEKEPIIICVGYHQSWSGQGGITNNYWHSSETINWSPTGGGSIVSNYSLTYYSDWMTSQTQSQWDSNGVGSTVTTSTGFVNGVTNNPPPSTNAYDGPTSFGGLQGNTYAMDAGSGSPPATGGEKANSQYFLYVRGEEVPAWQSLLAAFVGAQQVADPWYPAMSESWDSYQGDPFYWAISPTPVSYAQQMILGKSEDNTGKAIIMAPKGAVINAKVNVPGDSLVTVDPSVAQYHREILFNGGNVAFKNNITVVVGQQINLTFCLANGEPAMSNFTWTVNGYAISNFDVTTATLYTNFALSNSTVSFCWVNGGSNKVSCSALCGGIFNSATVTFNVLRPTVTMYTNVPTSFVASDFPLFDVQLTLGGPAPNYPGKMDYTVAINTPCFCQVGIQQVCWLNFSTMTNQVTNALDNVVWYSGPQPIAPGGLAANTNDINVVLLELNDSPGASGSSPISLQAAYTDYILCRPSTGGGNNSYVPIGKVEWDMLGVASYGWPTATINTNIVKGPSAPDGSTDFPTWTNVFINH